MYNARKTLLMLCTTALLAACSGPSRSDQAQALVEQARQLADTHSYDSAMMVLDTLDVKYRGCLEQRRQGTVVRLTALSALSRDSLAVAQLRLRTSQAVADSLAPQFKQIEVAGTDGYYVDKNVYSGTEMNRATLQGRVDDQGYFFIAVNYPGKGGIYGLEAGGVGTARAASVAIEGAEIMSLTQEKTAALMQYLAEATAPVSITVLGDRKNGTIKLDARQLASLNTTYRYALALQQVRRQQIILEKLERQLARLNDELANRTPAPAAAQ